MLTARRVAVVCCFVLVAIATLTPVAGEGGVYGCLICGELGLADAINNVILFVPIGVALAAERVGWRRTLLAAALFSGLVELAQATVIPGRDASPGDLLFNVAGALLGHSLPGLLGRVRTLSERAALRAALVAAAFVVALSAAGGWLLAPAPLLSEWFGQWTARLGQYEWYRGRVLRAELGGVALPNTRLERSAEVRQRLIGGDTLMVRFVAGPVPAGLAPVFSIYDRDRREMFVLGADRDDLVARVRARARMARLDQADLRWRGALSGVQRGDTLDLSFARLGGGFCMSAGPTGRCDLGLSPVRGWALLFAPVLPAWAEVVLDAATAAVLLVGVGLLARGTWGALLAFGTTVVALGLVPLAIGAGTVPLHGWAGAVLGFGIGTRLRARGRSIA